MNIALFWDVAPRKMIDIDRRFILTYCLHHQGDDDGGPDDGSSKHL
jgi:hypothetical protein